MNKTKRVPIRRLVETAWLLDRQEKVQVTRLMAVRHLVDCDMLGRDFYLFLLEESFRLYSQGDSLSTVQLIEDSHKTRMYENAIRLIKSLYGCDGFLDHGREAIDLYNDIYNLSSGWKRLYIHASRRKLEDPDLVLIEQTLRYVMNHWFKGNFAYDLAQYFVCDYARYRFLMTPASSPRVMSLAEFFGRRFLGGDIKLAW